MGALESDLQLIEQEYACLREVGPADEAAVSRWREQLAPLRERKWRTEAVQIGSTVHAHLTHEHIDPWAAGVPFLLCGAQPQEGTSEDGEDFGTWENPGVTRCTICASLDPWPVTT